MRLEEILKNTRRERYATGSFSPRYVPMIQPVLKAAKICHSPAIIQISQKEMNRYGICPGEFAEEFFRQKKELGITEPTTLHLDHTKEFDVIREAIEAGFESVMIDASEHEFEENVEITGKVVEYAHARKVSVEAELGKIGTTDMMETDKDEELYTDPGQALEFVKQTGVDALAVSVGTAHGVYTVKQPCVQLDIIKAIRDLTPVYLVLHGGSGVPSQMLEASYAMEGGGISKVNIATDLELAFLDSLGKKERGDNQWSMALAPDELALGRQAVQKLVEEKMIHYLHSDGKAW